MTELPEDLIVDFPLNIGQVIGSLSRTEVKRYLIERDIEVEDIRAAEKALLKIAKAFYYKEPVSFSEALEKLT